MLLLLSHILYAERTGQSFMFTRPVQRNLAAQQSIWHNVFLDKPPCGIRGAFQGIFLYQQTPRTAPDKIKRYFLINGKETLLVKGDNAVDAVNRDIRAEWLQLDSTYAGNFTINPIQEQLAFWGEYNQDIATFIHHPFFDNLWVSLAFTAQRIQNNLQFSSVTTSTTAPISPIANLDIAFSRNNMLYAKMADKKIKETSIAEIVLKLGATFLYCEGFQIAAYSLFLAPAHGRATPKFIFDAYISNNRHWGFGQGVLSQFPLNCSNEAIFAFYFNVENIFFLRNTQLRTFDLKNKPFSRYLLLNNRNGTCVNIPATNFLTREVRVEPFNQVDLSTGFRWYNEIVEVELGYDLWAHGNEEIVPRKPLPEEFGIAGSMPGITASNSTIDTLAPDDLDDMGNPTFVPIRIRDLDRRSVAARSALVHRAHGVIGFNIESDFGNIFAAVGGFYEIPNDNSALYNWGIWAKGGGAF